MNTLVMLADPTSPVALLVTFFLIMLATYGIVRLIMNPRSYEDFLKEWNLDLTDIRKEVSPEAVFQAQFDRLTFPLAIVFGVIGILPGIDILVFGVNLTFASYFGGFPLFLIISLITDFLSKLEQMATNSSTIVGRGTTPDLNLVYELEEEWEEEE